MEEIKEEKNYISEFDAERARYAIMGSGGDRMNMMDEWINGAYDEQGQQVYCSWCGGEMKWNPDKRIWFCRECESEMERSEYFNYIGAEPKDGWCETGCRENYPFCRQWCEKG